VPGRDSIPGPTDWQAGALTSRNSISYEPEEEKGKERKYWRQGGVPSPHSGPRMRKMQYLCNEINMKN